MGSLPNHYSEPVLGAMVSVSGTQITIEESEPNAYPSLHEYSDGEVDSQCFTEYGEVT